MPNRIYFVRHGESLQGAEEKHQFNDTALSPRGIEQAKLLARRFRTIPVDVIYSSPYERAYRTVQIINESIKKELVVSDLLRELRRPSEILGKSTRDPDVIVIKEEINAHAADPAWHYSDEENFYEMRERLSRGLALLEADPRDRLLIVCHGVILKVLTMLMTFGNAANHETYYAFYRHFRMTHTGITSFDKSKNGWLLMTWNDYAHLGEDTTEAAYK